MTKARKTAKSCPHGHVPQWIIDGDWKNPEIQCSVPECEFRRRMTLVEWNGLDGEANKEPKFPSIDNTMNIIHWNPVLHRPSGENPLVIFWSPSGIRQANWLDRQPNETHWIAVEDLPKP